MIFFSDKDKTKLDIRGNLIVNDISSIIEPHSLDISESIESSQVEPVKPSNRRLSMKMKELSQNYKEVRVFFFNIL